MTDTSKERCAVIAAYVQGPGSLKPHDRVEIAALITALQERVAEVERERANMTELREVAQLCLVDMRFRAEHAEANLAEALEVVRGTRPLVEKWCHYQGNTDELFVQYLGPIDGLIAKHGGTDRCHNCGGRGTHSSGGICNVCEGTGVTKHGASNDK